MFVRMNTLIKSDNEYYFIGEDQDWEIYEFETNSASPEAIVDIHTANANGFSNSHPRRFQVYDGRMFFNAYADGSETYWKNADLWSKGAAAGDYVLLADALVNDESPYIYTTMVEIDGRIYFSSSVKDGSVRQLVSYQTGEDSLRWHGNVEYPPGGFNEHLINLTGYNDQLIFSAFRDLYYHTQFFRFDTNTEVIELLPGLAGHVGEPQFIIGDHLFFTGTDTNNIWDQNFLSVHLQTGVITEVVNDSLFDISQPVLRTGDKALSLLRTPGTNDYTIQLFDPSNGQKSTILPAGYTSLRPRSMILHEGKVWFHHEEEGLSRVFTLDPLTEVCEEVFNLGSVRAKGEMIWFDGKLFFYGEDNTSNLGQELYYYDPQTGGVILYADINLGPTSSSVQSFFEFADRLYFIADDGHRGKELWSLSDCFSVTLEATPDPLGSIGGTIHLNISNGTAPFTYLWNTGATTQSIEELNTGYYEVTITDASGCEATAFVLLEGGIIVSTSEVTPPISVSIFPNPAHTSLTIQQESSSGPIKVYIFSLTGVKVWETENLSQNTTIDISRCSNGMYFVVLQNENNEMMTSKILIQH